MTISDYNLIMDKRDHDKCKNLNWKPIKTSTGKVVFRCKFKTGYKLLHRYIANATQGERIIFKNKNQLDYTRKNLIKTAQAPKKNSTVYRGVFKHRNGKFKAVLYLPGSGVQKYLGLFKCPHQAAKTYNEASIKQFKNKAYVNKSPELKKLCPVSYWAMLQKELDLLISDRILSYYLK